MTTTGQDDWRRGLEPRIADEVGYIKAAFRDRRNIEIGIEHDGAGVGYLYAVGELVVLDDHLERVLRALPDRIQVTGTRPVIAGITLVSYSGELRVPELLDVIDSVLGEGYVSPNHVLTVAGEVGPCPATEPEEVDSGDEPSPSACPGDSGAGVRIYIADTGLLPDAGTHPWLAGVTGDPDPLTPAPGGALQPYVGHGTFVAGVARCLAPGADIYVGNVFTTGGSALETDFVTDLQTALHRGVDIFHLSVASPTRKNLRLLSFWAWLRQLRRHKGIACVAPAGNSGTYRPHWPAASPRVLSAGALAADWRSRARFSNHGSWVDLYAPGRNLVNAYAHGEYVCQMAPYTGQVRHFYGMARWSGTSFSSPIVTGLIAARMWRAGENGAEAAAAVLREARSRAIPGLGAIAVPHETPRLSITAGSITPTSHPAAPGRTRPRPARS